MRFKDQKARLFTSTLLNLLTYSRKNLNGPVQYQLWSASKWSKKRLNRILKMSQSDQKYRFFASAALNSTPYPQVNTKCKPNAWNGPSTKTFDMFPAQTLALTEVLRTSIVFFTGHSRPNTIHFLLNYLNKVSFSQKERTLLSL